MLCCVIEKANNLQRCASLGRSASGLHTLCSLCGKRAIGACLLVSTHLCSRAVCSQAARIGVGRLQHFHCPGPGRVHLDAILVIPAHPQRWPLQQPLYVSKVSQYECLTSQMQWAEGERKEIQKEKASKESLGREKKNPKGRFLVVSVVDSVEQTVFGHTKSGHVHR